MVSSSILKVSHANIRFYRVMSLEAYSIVLYLMQSVFKFNIAQIFSWLVFTI